MVTFEERIMEEDQTIKSESGSTLSRAAHCARSLWLDFLAFRGILLSLICFIISLLFLEHTMSYGVIYFFVTIGWTFASLPLHVICLVTPISLEFLRLVPEDSPIKGFLLEESLGILAASIFYFPFKTSLVTRKLMVKFFIRFPFFPHNHLLMCIIISAALSTIFPAYFVVFFMLPFIESGMEILTSIDSKFYFGSSAQKKMIRMRQFDKAFKLAVSYSSIIGSTTSLVTSESGEIIYRVLVRSGTFDTELWYIMSIPIAIINLFNLWIVMLLVFLGVNFTKFSFYSNIETMQNLFTRKERNLSEKGFHLFKKHLEEIKKEMGHLSLTDAFMTGVMILVIVAAITRKSFYFKGWSDWIVIDILHLYKEGEQKHIHFSLIVSLAAILLFIVPSKKMSYIYAKDASTTDAYSMSSTVPIPISDWELVCKYIPWTAMLCVGTSINLFYSYQHTKIYHRVSIGLAHILGTESDETAVFYLYFIGLFLNIFNFSLVVSYMMVPISIHVARFQNINVAELLLVSLYGTRHSFITPFSCRSNLVVFYMTNNIRRSDMLKAGVPLLIVCTLTTLIYFRTFKNEFSSGFDLSVVRQCIFKLVG